MKSCAAACMKKKISCTEGECRYWIDYKVDFNCTYIAIDKNGPMKLREISERLRLTPARIQQIEKSVLSKLKKLM